MHIILADDHPLFREALRSTIRLGLPHARIEEAESIEAAKTVLAERPGIDVIVLDLSMKGVSGFDGMMSLRIRFPRIPILVCSGLEEGRIVREALRLGAAGFVPKSATRATLLEALDSIMRGSIYVPYLPDTLEAEASETADASPHRRPDARADERPVDDQAGQAQQADRVRTRHRRLDGEGPSLRDHAQARCAQPDPGGALRLGTGFRLRRNENFMKLDISL
jgi:DNA-binding NarL/FixJ family response regulator